MHGYIIYAAVNLHSTYTTDLRDDAEDAERDLDGVEVRVTGSELPNDGEPLARRGRRDDPDPDHVLMHGAALSPQRAAVGAGGQHAADGEAIPVRRVRQREAVVGGDLDEVAEQHAALHRQQPARRVHAHRRVQPLRADDGAVAPARARQLREAVRVAGGDLHLAPRRRRRRHRRHQLLLRPRERRVRRPADRAVRERPVRARHRAVGRAARAGYRVRRRAPAGEACQEDGDDEEEGDGDDTRCSASWSLHGCHGDDHELWLAGCSCGIGELAGCVAARQSSRVFKYTTAGRPAAMDGIEDHTASCKGTCFYVQYVPAQRFAAYELVLRLFFCLVRGKLAWTIVVFLFVFNYYYLIID